MLIVWGSKPRITVTDPEGARVVCPNCGVESRFIEKQVRTYFTLYWIPLFPMGRGEKLIECEYCHAQLLTTLEELRAQEAARHEEDARNAAAREASEREQSEEVERLQRHWQEQPEDRVSLCKLLDFLAGQGRYHRIQELEPGIRARYGEDPDVLLRLAHAAFALKRHADAIRDYETLLGQNPYRGDARYYLASSYRELQPPNWDLALQHMQIASDMGYQPAVEALPRLKRERVQAPLNS
jgi:tetratricopeptide (TPR) repeat protein